MSARPSRQTATKEAAAVPRRQASTSSSRKMGNRRRSSAAAAAAAAVEAPSSHSRAGPANQVDRIGGGEGGRGCRSMSECCSVHRPHRHPFTAIFFFLFFFLVSTSPVRSGGGGGSESSDAESNARVSPVTPNVLLSFAMM